MTCYARPLSFLFLTLGAAVEESFVSARRPGQRRAVFIDEPAIRWPDRPGTRSRTGAPA